MRCVRSRIGVALTMAGMCLGPVGPTSGFDNTSARPDSAVTTSLSDSVYTLPAIVVRAEPLTRQQELDRLPGAATVITLDDRAAHLTTTAEILERVPGLHVREYGSLGTYSTVSIRGSSAQQVNVYLDGVPLSRAGLGVVNLADLPFAALERVEVYRGFTPPSLPGAGLGGAINLVTRRPEGARGESSLRLGGGSFGTERLGFSQRIGAGSWDALFIADRWQSDGDFEFHDDNGTPAEPGDDAVVPRQNNDVLHEEILAQIARPFARGGSLRISNQWVRRRQGVPGISNSQSLLAHAGVHYDITSIEMRTPRFAAQRAQVMLQTSHDWRRDVFVDRASEIGLGYQDNRDVTRAWGARTVFEITTHDFARTALEIAARRESFAPWRGFSRPAAGPIQRRTSFDAAIDERLRFGSRLDLHCGWRWTESRHAFSGDLRTPYSPRPAQSGVTTYREPRIGARLRLWNGFHARASAGEYHRTPGFLELFGDGGSVAGNSALLPESGTNHDAGLQFEASPGTTRFRLEATYFDRDVRHLIALIPQAQRTFVARNIGAAAIRGEEFAWGWSDAGRRWSLEGNYSHLRAIDRSTDITWYTGKTLPGRPEHEFFQRVTLRLGAGELGYEFDYLGRNPLDQWNATIVPRRALHALDIRIAWRRLAVHGGVRNLTDERAMDVANFPLPGRTLFASSSVRF